MSIAINWLATMELSARLIALRKERGLSQQAMADAVGVHVNQIKRYEAALTYPSLEALKKLAVTLHVTTDSLLFGDAPRGPDEDLRLQFEAISQFDEHDKEIARSVLEGLILKHQAKQSLQRQAMPQRSQPATGSRTKPAAKRHGTARERASA